MKASIRFWATITLLLQLAGCGGSGDEATSASDPGSGIVVAGAPTVSLHLIDPVSKATIGTVSVNKPGLLVVTVTDTSGRAVANQTVTLSHGNNLLQIDGFTNYDKDVTTDNNGQATAVLTPGSNSNGASSVIATVKTSAGTGTKTIAVNIVSVDYTLKMDMVKSSSKEVTRTISAVSPAQVTATLLSPSGVAVVKVPVVFSLELSGDSLNGADVQQTGVDGTASIILSTTRTISTLNWLSATATVDGKEVTTRIAFTVENSTFTLGSFAVDQKSIPSTGATTFKFLVAANGEAYKASPLSVSFSSVCASSGKATITKSAITDLSTGYVTGTYTDNGCNNGVTDKTDTITATLDRDSLITGTGTVTIKPPTPSKDDQLGFVSLVTEPPISPPMLALKGMGGPLMSERAKVTFAVKDSNGNPLGGRTVIFSAAPDALGGLKIDPLSATSDPTTGEVSTYVYSGNISTSISIKASLETVPGSFLNKYSDMLVISTGIPAQDSFSLSVDKHNIEGDQYDGEIVQVTARLADHFHNPVPDGTAVNFKAEGGAIQSQCRTKYGTIDQDGVEPLFAGCSVNFNSQNLRPLNGRVTILATAIGEEAFIDLDGDGVVSSAAEMIDANRLNTDLSEAAFVDYNENGRYDAANEPYFYSVSGGKPDSGDGLYNGVLCKAGAAICSAQKSIYVRGSAVIVFSTSTARIVINNPSGTSNANINLPKCDPATGNGSPINVPIVVVDGNGNAMPVGTTIDFSTTNGKLINSTTEKVQDTAGCRTGFVGCPPRAASDGFETYSVSIQTDATFKAAVKDAAGAITTPSSCTNDVPSGALTVTVKTPKGHVTKASVDVTD